VHRQPLGHWQGLALELNVSRKSHLFHTTAQDGPVAEEAEEFKLSPFIHKINVVNAVKIEILKETITSCV
jgi:hypothetical protein